MRSLFLALAAMATTTAATVPAMAASEPDMVEFKSLSNLMEKLPTFAAIVASQGYSIEQIRVERLKKGEMMSYSTPFPADQHVMISVAPESEGISDLDMLVQQNEQDVAKDVDNESVALVDFDTNADSYNVLIKAAALQPTADASRAHYLMIITAFKPK